MIVGEGPLRSELETLAEPAVDRIHFAGFRNQSELPAYYAASDVLVLPSEAETWGLVTNEAMACGLACIVSDAAGCGPDLIVEGKTGYRYPPGEIQTLCDCLLTAISRPDPAALAAAIQDRVQKYSLDTATAGLTLALEQLSARRSRPGLPAAPLLSTPLPR